MKPMQPVKIIPSIGDERGRPEGYCIIMTDGEFADIAYFNKWGDVQESKIQYCRKRFEIYCENTKLKQL